MQVDLLCDQISGTVPPVKAGKIKAYAAAGKARLPGRVGHERGWRRRPGHHISFGLYSPRGTPRPVQEQLTGVLQKAVADPEVRARLEGMGIAAVSHEQATPQALRQHLMDGTRLWAACCSGPA